jgi:hypothetical protein
MSTRAHPNIYIYKYTKRERAGLDGVGEWREGLGRSRRSGVERLLRLVGVSGVSGVAVEGGRVGWV